MPGDQFRGFALHEPRAHACQLGISSQSSACLTRLPLVARGAKQRLGPDAWISRFAEGMKGACGAAVIVQTEFQIFGGRELGHRRRWYREASITQRAVRRDLQSGAAEEHEDRVLVMLQDRG